uniref:BTB domain-containing protein n=1 Tax=Panagrellus redivivus TaxID=6233 RepID=A0A7E4WB23_PANRE
MNTMTKLKTLKTLQDKETILIRNFWFYQTEEHSFVHESDVYTWDLCYNTVRDGLSANGEVRMTLEFDREVDGNVTVEAIGLPTKTFAFSKTKKCTSFHVPFRPIYSDIDGELEVTFTVEIYVEVDYILEVRTDFTEYHHIPTDFEIHCENKQCNVHKDVLSKVSPVFEAMLQHNFIEKSCNKLQITDFDFITVQTVLNICYGCPPSELSVELSIKVLHFAEKYLMTDITTELEKVLAYNISIHNFCAVFRYADCLAKTSLYSKCVTFYRTNEKAINTIDDFTALPEPLITKLLKTTFRLETEFDVFMHASENGIPLGIVAKPFSITITTLADFFGIVPYTWNHNIDSLKMKCGQFFQQNKYFIENRFEFKYYSQKIQDSLVCLGRCFQLPTNFHEYYDIPTDFKIQCGNNFYEVHKDVLSKISPVFKAMIQNNVIESSSNKLEIKDFSFETVEIALNYCYERPLSDLSVALVIDVLYFANKYDMIASFVQLEGLLTLMYDVKIDHYAVFRYAEDCGRAGLLPQYLP